MIGRIDQKNQEKKSSIPVFYVAAIVTSVVCLTMIPKMEVYSKGVLLTGAILLWCVAIVAGREERKAKIQGRKREQSQQCAHTISAAGKLGHMNDKYRCDHVKEEKYIN